jgi:hypothetical protein
MKHRFHVIAIHREEPDLRLYVAALLALAMRQLEDEKAARRASADAAPPEEARE